MKVAISNTLGDTWATEEQLAAMTDDEIIEMICDDLVLFTDGAKWEIERDRE